MVVTVICALSSYVLLGTALTEMADKVVQALRPSWPFDVTAEGRFTPEQLSSVRALSGVVHVETIRSYKVFLGPGLQEVLSVPDAGTALSMELSSGLLPTEADELVVPELLADALKLTIGDRVRIVGQMYGASAHDYIIVGILSGKAGVVTSPLLTIDGIALIRAGENYINRMLIQLDGTTDLNAFAKSLGQLLRDSEITLEAQGYAAVEQNRSLSDSLVLVLRSLILMITAASLAVLFYLSQRSGAYQTGVLRAMGVQRAWLFVPSMVLALLVFAFGIPVTALILPVVAGRVGLHTAPELLLRTLAKDSGTYVLVGLFSTVAINWQFLSQPIPKLLKDSW